MSIELKTLVLHVTDACNLGCRYCYYGNDGHAAAAKEKMSPETAARAVDFLMEHSGNSKEVIIVFFGGEPLLNLDLIRFIVADARKKAMEKGIRVDFAVTTNGTLLTDKTIAFLRENNIGVTISIDGFETAHDRFRRFPNGAPSYGAILPGLTKFLARQGRKTRGGQSDGGRRVKRYSRNSGSSSVSRVFRRRALRPLRPAIPPTS